MLLKTALFLLLSGPSVAITLKSEANVRGGATAAEKGPDRKDQRELGNSWNPAPPQGFSCYGWDNPCHYKSRAYLPSSISPKHFVQCGAQGECHDGKHQMCMGKTALGENVWCPSTNACQHACLCKDYKHDASMCPKNKHHSHEPLMDHHGHNHNLANQVKRLEWEVEDLKDQVKDLKKKREQDRKRLQDLEDRVKDLEDCSKCEFLAKGGWMRVRHVPALFNWHPATDSLVGTDVYGTECEEAAPWSITFNGIDFDQFLFATGDCVKWLVATKEAVIGENYSNELRDIIESSTSEGISYQAKWFNRGDSHPEDPWVSLLDHFNATDTGNILYGENDITDHVSGVLPQNNGADVYIRKSVP